MHVLLRISRLEISWLNRSNVKYDAISKPPVVAAYCFTPSKYIDDWMIDQWTRPIDTYKWDDYINNVGLVFFR